MQAGQLLPTELRDRSRYISETASANDFVYSPHLERLLEASRDCGVRIETTVALSPSLELQVAHGVIDAALLNLPLSSEPAGLIVRPIAPSKLCLLVTKNHALARLSRIRPSALQGVPLIMCPDAPANAFARQCEKLFVAGGITPSIAQRTTSTAILEDLVERGLGVGVVSEHSVRPRNSRLKLIPFDAEESLYRHAVAYRSDRGSKDLLELLSSLESDRQQTKVRLQSIAACPLRSSPEMSSSGASGLRSATLLTSTSTRRIHF